MKVCKFMPPYGILLADSTITQISPAHPQLFLALLLGHPLLLVTYTSKQQRLTTKKTSADNCRHLHLSFFGFERTFYVLNWHSFMFWTIYQKLVTQQQVSGRISLLLFLLQYKRWVSKASQRTFGLSTGLLFAWNDSKTSFEQSNKSEIRHQLHSI
jgi:hypothetical protein